MAIEIVAQTGQRASRTKADLKLMTYALLSQHHKR
jgi:hypothetical protein